MQSIVDPKRLQVMCLGWDSATVLDTAVDRADAACLVEPASDMMHCAICGDPSGNPYAAHRFRKNDACVSGDAVANHAGDPGAPM